MKTPSIETSVDDLDLRILDQMQADSSISNQELALRVNASAPTCLRRVRRLMEAGVIEKQVAILNPQKVASSLTAIIEITLDIQTAEYLDAFEASMEQASAVLQCYRVSPGPDFIVVAKVAEMTANHAMAHQMYMLHGTVCKMRTFFTIKV